MLQAQEDISSLLASSQIDPSLESRLQSAMEILQFAHAELQLPDNGSYREYADIQRDYVVWNVIAAPEFSTQAITWCYALVGCLPYRGYYSEQAALNHAEQLQDQSYEVFTGGVNAYSTLGWFNDPILNTMLKSDNIYLAKLIFHELTHQKFYVRDDADFNEALADAIARIGVLRWLEQQGKNTEGYSSELYYQDMIITTILNYQEQLDTIYNSSQPDSLKRLNKQRHFKNLQDDLASLTAIHPAAKSLATAYLNNLNNAKLSIISTYRRWVPVLISLYQELGHSLDEFYQRVELLIRMDKTQRRQFLHAYNK